MKKTWFVTLLALGAAVSMLFCSGCDSGQDADRRAGDINMFRDALERSGFTVQEGAYGYQDAIALCSAGLIDNCQGANVGAPYLAYKLPPAPGQQTQNVKVDPRDGLAFAYHLREDEAIVQIGRTPPQAGFFSYQSYLVMRYEEANKQYQALFNSIGDTINNRTIKTESSTEDTFDQPVIIISTADRKVDELVRQAAVAAGYPQGIMNTDVIPSSVVRMGLEDRTDLLGFVSRVAIPASRDALSAYIDNPGAVVFRVTPREPMTPDPFGVPRLRVRGTGETELHLLPALEELRQAILAEYQGYRAAEAPAFVALPEGYNATQSLINALGDNRDAAYFSTVEVDAWTKKDDPRREAAFLLPDDPDDFVIVYGVNHETTGKATYANCVVYGLRYLNGVATFDSRECRGSAERYLPGHPQAPYLYAWKIARNSNGEPHCLEVPAGPQSYGIGLDDRLILFFRAYLEEATQTGPAHNELVMDRMIKFSRGQ